MEEGFGHFVATTTFDDPSIPGAIFGYYKEILRPDVIPNIPQGHCHSVQGVCADSFLGSDWPMALPPVPVDAESPFKLRNTLCGPLPSDDLTQLANEHDFMQFFHAVHTQGAPLDMSDVYAVLRTTCNGRHGDCDATGTQCTPCTSVLPGECDTCQGICTHDPCEDVDNPFTCGRACTNAVNDLGDGIRWSAILPIHLDGFDDPNVVGDEDVGPREVSLVDGASRFLAQKTGSINSQEFQQFLDNGVNHGITPSLTP